MATIIQWNRLEARPRSSHVAEPLRAEVRDALWFLTRQWQMGGFEGEDTGTPTTADIHFKTSKLQNISRRNNPATPIPNSSPLEATVERELVEPENDAYLSMVIVEHWESLLSANTEASGALSATSAFNATTTRKIMNLLNKNDNFSLEQPDLNSDREHISSATFQADPDRLHFAQSLAKRSFNAGQFYRLLKNGTPADSLITSLSLSSNQRSDLNVKGELLVIWFDKQFSQPVQNEATAWNPSRLEYKFALSALSDNKSIILDAEEYHHGHLDWYAFELAKTTNRSLIKDLDPALNHHRMDVVFPAEIEFRGMPRSRWWEFEDHSINFGSIQPQTSDTGKLLFTEFGLLFANDWSIVPLTIPAGNLLDIESIEVRDTFGQITLVDHYKTYDNSKHWGLFQLHDINKSTGSQVDRRLLVPPVAHQILESEPIETVNFIRDEMANMVWGIERTVPDGHGGSLDGYHLARQTHQYYIDESQDVIPKVDNDAKIKYQITSEIPENWIPFVPVKSSDSILNRQIKLQRAILPRVLDGIATQRISPRTNLLTDVESPYFIHEQEIQRAGVIVERTWQRARMEDGSVVVWLGRRKKIGRGEGTSGLNYDQIDIKR